MHFTIGTAGHVDHGKTTIVKALTGVDTDTLKEEKERGLSIALGFAHTELAGGGASVPVKLSFIDVPGHERFIGTMLAGTSGIDAVLLVVAADDGPMPQTLEHLEIIERLGITRGVVAVTKADAVSEERVTQVLGEVTELIGVSVLKGARVLPVSAVTNDGIDALKQELLKLCAGVASRSTGPYFRLPIDRVFAVKGFGAVVTGTVASGAVGVGSEVALFPPSKEEGAIKLRGIESRNEKVERVEAGQRAALNLKNVSHKELRRGQQVADPELVSFARGAIYKDGRRARLPVLTVECALSFSRSIKRPLKDRSVLKLHHLTGEALATLRLAPSKLRANEAGPGEGFYGRLLVRGPLLILRGDRFILRDTADGAVVGGGRVLLSYLGKRAPQRISDVDFEALDGGKVEGLIQALFSGRDAAMLFNRLPFILNLSKEELGKEIPGYESVGGYLAPRDRLSRLRKKLLDLLGEHHVEKPAEPGILEASLMRALSKEYRFDGPFFSALKERLIKEGVIETDGAAIRLKGHAAELSDEDAIVGRRIEALLGDEVRTRTRDELLSIDIPKKDIERVLSFLVKSGRVARLGGGGFISAKALASARERLTREVQAMGKIKVTDFRDALGCGRKLAIEILEYFDNKQITLRQGDYRTLR